MPTNQRTSSIVSVEARYDAKRIELASAEARRRIERRACDKWLDLRAIRPPDSSKIYHPRTIPDNERLYCDARITSRATNLPQCDILIVASNAPSLLRLEDTGIEVVPYESVGGILEVKRTLTKDTGAFNHLASIVESIGRSKNLKTDKVLNRANMAVGSHNHSSDKPNSTPLTASGQAITAPGPQPTQTPSLNWSKDSKKKS
jgi:hypothetical protein